MFRYKEVSALRREIHGAHDDEVLWRSVWLRKATLVSFTTLFTAMWISLILIWRYDVNQDGFALTISSSHYSWVYGPTAILTIVVSLWRQVDYYCKISQPWKDMRIHITDASKSLLLDYISPLQVKSLYRATKNRHWAVAASTLGFMILKFITIVSTVLFHSSPTLQSRTVPVITGSKFSESTFWNFVGWNREHSSHVVSSPGPLYAYEGIVENGLPYPNGTIERYAFQDVSLLEMRENVTSLTSLVTAFRSNVSCEISSTQLDSAVDLEEWVRSHTTITTPTCLASNLTNRESIISPLDPYLQDDPPHVLTFTFTPVNCSTNGTVSSTSPDNNPASIQSDTLPDLRLAIIIKVYTAPRTGLSFPENFTLSRSAATVCAVDYDLREMYLNQDLTTRAITLDNSRSESDSHKFNNLTKSELAESVFALVAGHAEDRNVLDLMKATLKDPLPGYESLMDEGNLTSSASKVLGGLMAQMVQQFVLVPDAAVMNGTARFAENRLHVLPFSLWIMVTASIVLSFFPVVIMLSSVDRVVSQDPTTVAAHAAILTSSKSLRSLLRRAATLRTSELTKWLDGHLFKTALDKQGFYIETVGSAPLFHKAAKIKPGARPQDTVIEDRSSGNASLLPEDIVSKRGSWIPGNARYRFITTTLVLPILAIGGLELLYQESERNQGLTDTSSGVRAYVGYFASFVVVIISSTLNSVDFTFASFAPFSVLSRRGKHIPRSTLVNPIGEMPPIALYRAFRTRQTGAVFSSLAALIGSVLTIIASGLWVDHPLECNAGLKTTLASTWNFSWPETSFDDGGAARTLKILQFQEGEQPPGTWNDLVFPTISDLSVYSDKSRTNLSITCSNPVAEASCHYHLKLPVLRPQLDCEPISAEEMDQSLIFQYAQVTAANGTAINGTSQYISFHPNGIRLPGGCEAYEGYYVLGFDNHYPDWYGLFVNIATVSQSMAQQTSGSGNTSLSNDPHGCPSIAVIFGSQLNSRPTKQDFTILSCRQKIQKIDTFITFTKPTDNQGLIGSNNLLQDPAVEESSAEYVINSEDGTDSFYYRIDHTLQQEFPDVGHTTIAGHNLSLDRGFTAVINGPNVTTLEGLSHPNRTEKLQKAVTEFYRKYMVLIMNTQVFRKPIDASQDHDVFEGTVTTECSRLTVDFASKLTLQIMLAIILVLSGLAFWLGELRGMLPRNPCSIASVMALLANSRICSRGVIPLGAEWRSNDELARQFESYNVKLGWWEIEGEEQNDQQRYRFGIDIGEPVSMGFKAGKAKKLKP
ncbi:hypothetical protein F4679DRAFT_539599 [Xylaria curta]|nr:hypothetical protein F4679DRAFT_539599 [Xylaria curta]